MEKFADRLILHCDLNNFYASVECLLNPALRSVPMAVSGDAQKRHGIILAKNEIAKRQGVKTAETLWQARQKSPDLVLVPPHHELYMQYSRQVFELYTRFTPLVEPFGPDECWLDVTGCNKLFGTGRQIADKIRETIKRETGGLTVSVGVSYNKVFAKMGSDLKKPDATTVITRTNFRDLLWPLPVGDLLAVGRKTAEKLHRLGISTVGELAQADETLLKAHFGVVGQKMIENARGENRETVREAVRAREAESVGHGMTTTRDLCTYAEVETLLYYLADRVAARMRKQGLRGSGVAVDLRDNNLQHLSRQKQLALPTCSAVDIARAAVELTHAHWPCSPPLRTVTVSVFALRRETDGIQLSLFDTEQHDRAERLEKAIDGIRAKYGGGAIARGNLIARDFLYDRTDDEDFLPFRR